jgi:hypothetical protein
MRRHANDFDEVMIVNPSDSNQVERVRLMRFHNINPPEFNGFAGPDPYGYYGQVDPTYGYYAEVDPTYGYYGEVDPAYGYYAQVDPTYGYYGEVDPAAYGYFAQVDPTYGYYAQAEPAYNYYGQVDPTYGYYGEVDPAYGYYGYQEQEPVGYYAEEYPVGNYAPEPAMGVPGSGYGESGPQYGDRYSGYYSEPNYSGYVRETPPAFNAGCPLPTNVNGFADGDFDGYVRPATVNPTCSQMIEQPGSPALAPETFKPLW